MKKIITLIFIFFTMTLFSQGLILRSQEIVKNTNNLKINLPVLHIPIFVKNIVHDTIAFENYQTTNYPNFYPDNLLYVNPYAEEGYVQKWFSKEDLKYIEIKDKELKESLKIVKRIINGEVYKERRWVSIYSVTLYYQNGNTVYFPSVRIITNIDIHKPYPQIIPGSRYLIYNGFDDPNSIFNNYGNQNTKDGGLIIDYDEYSN